MKIIKGLAIVFTILILLGSCFDPPEFPNEPEIVYQDLVFKETAGNAVPDSLILTIRFKDGNGDLGLESGNLNFPFHELDFFVSNGTAQKTAVGTNTYTNIPKDLLLASGVTGKLLTLRHIRTNSAYSALPRFTGFFRCINYLVDTIAVSQNDSHVIDNSYKVVDTLKFTPQTPDVYLVADTFYIEANPNHYNLKIDFLVKDPTLPGPADADGFKEFDWRTYSPNPDNCGQTFDARVPVLTGTENALDGSITYVMESRGFRDVLKTNLLKLQIQMFDRGLNPSNVIKTPPFTLDDLRQ